MLAIPVTEKVCVFTDHSCILFLKDGTPCESILLDNSVKDAGLCKSDICLYSSFICLQTFWMENLYVAEDVEIFAFD